MSNTRPADEFGGIAVSSDVDLVNEGVKVTLYLIGEWGEIQEIQPDEVSLWVMTENFGQIEGVRKNWGIAGTAGGTFSSEFMLEGVSLGDVKILNVKIGKSVNYRMIPVRSAN